MTKNDTKYLHAAARVHSLENQMISRQELLKAIEAASAQEAFKVLSGKGLFRDFPMKEYEKALEQELKETYQLAENITGKSQITCIFRYPADGHNLKVYAKSQATEGDFEQLYKETGTFSPETMKQELTAKRFDKIPGKLGQAALYAMERLAKTRDPQIASIIIDNAVLELISEKAHEIGNPLLIEYAASKIDLINIETAIRLMRMKKEPYQVRKMLAEGGTLSPADISGEFSAGYEGMLRLTDRAGKKKRMEKSIAALKQGQPLSVFEENLDACFKDLFDRAKIIPFGLEPVIAFLYQKEQEIRAVRLVLAAKLFGLPKDRIAERVRYIYAD